ncbi:MAG TPA: hypothetical protein DCE56_24735 [Cyanobacteria bacterium UBA8553]|nr:hypothetical protein [Cyanobacteria bacterium UBA8553]
MKSRIYARKKSTREQTPDFSTAPAPPMFQSRPFVVQSKEGEKSNQQKTDLKTQLSRATRFGHILRKRPEEQSKAVRGQERKAVQRKEEEKQAEPNKSEGMIQLAPKKTNIASEQPSEAEQKYFETQADMRKRQAGPDEKSELLDAFIEIYGLKEDPPHPGKIFKAICDYTINDQYAGTASSVHASLNSRVWNCESLASLMCEIWRKLGGRGASLDKIEERRISAEGIHPQMTTFRKGNVIDRRTDRKNTTPTRTSFESHTRAKIDGVIYDPLMGVYGGGAESIWEHEVEASGKIAGSEDVYRKTDQQYGPLKVGVMERKR